MSTRKYALSRLHVPIRGACLTLSVLRSVANETRVMGYSSSDPDLQSWTANVALELPDEFHRRGCRVFNTDVHPGAGAANGGYEYVMALEMQGHPWCPTASRNFFAVHDGGDLTKGWRLLNVTEALHPQPGDTYPSECMTIRYFEPYYYLIFGSCKIVMPSRFATLPVSLTRTASLFQTGRCRATTSHIRRGARTTSRTWSSSCRAAETCG